MEHVEHVLSNISGCPGILQMKPSIAVLVYTVGLVFDDSE